MSLGYLVNHSSFPPIEVWLPHLFLVGEFFHIPNALAGVAWTLRIEILFYLFMACLKLVKLFQYPSSLPLIFLLATLLLDLLGPFPLNRDWDNGYVTLYFPFLFVGVLIYLIEKKLANLFYCLIVMIWIFGSYFILLPIFNPSFMNSNFVIFAFLIFVLLWLYRNYCMLNPVITFIANLTYAIYLFHKWLWPYLGLALTKIGLNGAYMNLRILSVLFLICILLHYTIEKGGIKLGKILLHKKIS